MKVCAREVSLHPKKRADDSCVPSWRVWCVIGVYDLAVTVACVNFYFSTFKSSRSAHLSAQYSTLFRVCWWDPSNTCYEKVLLRQVKPSHRPLVHSLHILHISKGKHLCICHDNNAFCGIPKFIVVSRRAVVQGAKWKSTTWPNLRSET